MAAVAAMVLVFLVVPFGWQGAAPAVDPATSTSPGAPPESLAPQTWVLSSTVVTSLPPENAAEDARPGNARPGDAGPGGPELGDAGDPVERPGPWIIRVPRATPTGTADDQSSASDSGSPSSGPSRSSASPTAPATTSAPATPATPTSVPGSSCPPVPPEETAPLPAVGDGVGAAADGPSAADLGSTAGPVADPARVAPTAEHC